MELFDLDNPFYANSSSEPTLPAPHFSQIQQFNIESLNVQKPNYYRFQPARCTITIDIAKKTRLDVTGLHPMVPNNPFLVHVNKKELEDVNNQIAQVKKEVKAVRRKLQDGDRLYFQTELPRIRMKLIQKHKLDITLQRESDPFFYIRDHTSRHMNVLCTFSSQKSANWFLRSLNTKHIGCDVRLVQLGSEGYDCSELTYHRYDQKLLQFSRRQEMNSEEFRCEQQQIESYLDGEEFQIIFLDLPFSRDLDFYYTLWVRLAIILCKNLQDGGCLVFKVRQFETHWLIYFLYLFAQIFTTIHIEKDTSRHHMLSTSIFVGCYGYIKSHGQSYYDDLIASYAKIPVNGNNDNGLFNYRTYLKDNEFQKEMTHFFSALHTYRKYQLQIYKWCEQQLHIDVPIEQIISEMIKDQQTPERSDRRDHHNQRSYHHNQKSFDRNNNGSHSKQQGPVVMNPVPEISKYKATFNDESPRQHRDRKKPQQPVKAPENEKELLLRRKQEEEEKIEKLMQRSDKKVNRKEHKKKEEQISRFSR